MPPSAKLPKYLAEAVGTFCLVFAGTGAVVVNEVAGGRLGLVGICLAFGLVVLAMVYTVGHISGAHLNPAVSVAFWSLGRHPGAELAPYILAQAAGAVAASGSLRLMFSGQATSLGLTLPAGGWGQAFAMEFVITAILMLVITAVATDDRAEGTLAGLAVGAAVCLLALVGGPVSGASMNPARSLGPALVALRFESLWVYLAAPVLGAVCGARLYTAIRCPSGPASASGCC